MLRKVLHATVSALLLAGGLLGAWAVVAGRPAPSEQELPGPRPVPVRTVMLAPQDVPRDLSAIGTLKAGREALLAPELGGRVVSVAAGLADGATLRAGASLVQLDPVPTELELAAERTALQLARVRLETANETLASALRAVTLAEEQLVLLRADEGRWRGLVESGRAERTRLDLSTRARLAGEVALEDARLASRSASGAVDAGDQEVALAGQRIALLEDRLGRLAVRAPFDGAFALLPGGSGRLPEVGEVLTPGGPLGSLLVLNELQLVCDVHVDDAASLHLGARAVAAPAGRPGLLLEGQVTSVGVRVEPRTRTVRVEARVAAPAEGVAALADGAFCRASITGRPLRDVLHLDAEWVAFRGGAPVAFVVEADDAGVPRARLAPLDLEPGEVAGGRVVRGGLRPGQQVVTGPLELVGDGVEVVLAAPASGGGR